MTQGALATTIFSRAEFFALHRRSLARSLVHAAANIALYATLACVAATTSWATLRVFAWICMGILLCGCLNAAHDCAHQSFAASRRVNRVFGLAWCLPLLASFTLFKKAHFVHHRYTRVPGDSESLHTIDSLREYLNRMFVRNPAGPLKRAIHTAFLRKTDEDDRDQKQSLRTEAVALCLWCILLATLTGYHPVILIETYWVPYLLAGPFIAAFALPEHHGLGASDDLLDCTRSVISGVLMRIMLWNGGFHAEHHLYPGMPSSNLPAVNRRLRSNRRNQIRSYAAFHWQLLTGLWRTSRTV